MPATERTRIGLWIEPLDVLFFREGRPFGPATRAEGGLPQPQTLAGALRSAVLAASGFDFATLARRVREGMATDEALVERGAPPGLPETRFRGPWLARRPAPTQVEPLLPIPLSLYREESGKWHRADPLSDDLPGWDPPHAGRRPLWHRGGPDAKRPGGFLRPSGIEAFLRGGVPTDDDRVMPGGLYGYDHRTGLEIDADTLTGVEGRLFATRFVALKPGVGFYAEMLPPRHAAEGLKGLLREPFPWGGEGRYATASLLEHPVEWPCIEGGNPLWLLATPAMLAQDDRVGRMPGRIAPGNLMAVASGPGVAVSGWDLARGGPRPTRFVAPAGSVYFVEPPGPIGDESSLCGDPEDVAQGWGFALRGVWNHA